MPRARLLSLLALSGCGWFEKPETCQLASTSCDGDAIRVCVADSSAATSSGVPATRWNVLTYCADDPILGPQTCAVVSGSAVCVLATADGGVATPEDFAEGHYLRVRVRGGEIEAARDTYLDARPMSAGAGQWALVARAGDRATDAALVREGQDAWVWGDGVTRLELVDVDGSVRSLLDLDVPTRRGLGRRVDALVGDLPATVQLLKPEDRDAVPSEVSATFGRGVRMVEPSAAALAVLSDAMRRVTLTAASAVGSVAFITAADERPDMDDAGVPPSGSADAGVEEVEPGNPRPLDARAYYDGTALWVDASPSRVEALAGESNEPVLMMQEVARAVGEAVVFVSSATREGAAVGPGEPRLPEDFPPEISELLKARLLPLLSPGEDVAGAWGALHAAAAKAGLTKYYDATSVSVDDRQAVADGLASARGRVGAAQDFSDYLALLAVPEAYPISTCAGFDGRPLEQLEVRQMTPLVKVLAIFGLGLVDRPALQACTGNVEWSQSAPGIVAHKASGESVTFAAEPQAVRGPYYSGATRWAGTASRRDGEEVALVQVVYRDRVPELVRVRTVTGTGGDSPTQRQSASFSLATPRGGDVAAAQGGLLLLRSATRERFEGILVNAVLGGDVLGANVWPLVLFRFDAPLWQQGEP